jgi:hypothetical protein
MSETRIKITLTDAEVSVLDGIRALQLCSIQDAIHYLIHDRKRAIEDWKARNAQPRPKVGRPPKVRPKPTAGTMDG